MWEQWTTVASTSGRQAHQLDHHAVQLHSSKWRSCPFCNGPWHPFLTSLSLPPLPSNHIFLPKPLVRRKNIFLLLCDQHEASLHTYKFLAHFEGSNCTFKMCTCYIIGSSLFYSRLITSLWEVVLCCHWFYLEGWFLHRPEMGWRVFKWTLWAPLISQTMRDWSTKKQSTLTWKRCTTTWHRLQHCRQTWYITMLQYQKQKNATAKKMPHM